MRWVKPGRFPARTDIHAKYKQNPILPSSYTEGERRRRAACTRTDRVAGWSPSTKAGQRRIETPDRQPIDSGMAMDKKLGWKPLNEYIAPTLD